MHEIAILIPTYGRAHKLAGIKANIEATCKQNIYIICSEEDPETFNEATRLGLNIIISGGRYVEGINLGYKLTDEPYLLFGADDIEFTPDWDKKLLKYFDDPKIGIVGSPDDWTISQTGKHGSHPLVKRAYIQEFSGTYDEPDIPYSPFYKHYMADIETEQVAQMRGAWVQGEAEIKHHHWVNKQAEKDATYVRGMKNLQHDMEVYNDRRKNFEQYLFEPLFNGRVVAVDHATKLSIIMGSFNAFDMLKQTVRSLKKNTYYPYELIIVDDCSDSRVKTWLENIGAENPNITVVFNDCQQYTNAVWNRGVLLAKNDYIAVINNDITFSQWWDAYLVEALKDKKVGLANPYQTDREAPTPYANTERAGGYNIRGACYMFKKQDLKGIFPIPEKLRHWWGDIWVLKQVEKMGKKSVWCPDAVIHHFGEQSTQEANKDHTVDHIKLKDCQEFTNLTGTSTTKWQNLILSQINR